MADSNNNNTNASAASLPANDAIKRLLWPALKKATGSGTHQVYPFLAPDNAMDRAYVRVLLVERPYKAQYGSGTEVWERCADSLRKQKDNKQQPIFQAEITLKALKERFKKYISFVNEEQSAAPFRSGCDDEAEPEELIAGLEDLFEDYNSYLDASKLHKNATTLQKVKDKADATAIKNAAVGGFARNKRNNDDNSSNSGSIVDATNESPPSKKSKRSSTQSAAKSTASSQSILENLQEIEIFKSRRDERQLEKSHYKSEKLKQKSMELQMQQQKQEFDQQIQREKLELEQRRFKLEELERKSSAQLNVQLATSVAQLLTVQAQLQQSNSQSQQSNSQLQSQSSEQSLT